MKYEADDKFDLCVKGKQEKKKECPAEVMPVVLYSSAIHYFSVFPTLPSPISRKYLTRA